MIAYLKLVGQKSRQPLKGPVMTTGQTSSEPEKQPGVPDDLFQVHKALIDKMWELWKLSRDEVTPKIDHIKYSRVSTVTFTHIAAIIAVDVGMDEEKFLATCKANYAAAVKHAPKFG
jgi:hypothetical protein